MKNTYICTTTTNKRTYKPVIRMTEKGVSDYANAMYAKHGDSTTVEVVIIDDNCNIVPVCTYHA